MQAPTSGNCCQAKVSEKPVESIEEAPSCCCQNKAAEPVSKPMISSRETAGETPSCCRVRPAPKSETSSAAGGAACCQIRPSEKAPHHGKTWSDRYEDAEPVLIILSALALLASFFHWGHGLLPFDSAWLAILFCGAPRFSGAFRALSRRRVSVDVLISTAIVATILADRLFPADGHHSYLFAGGEVAFIMSLGHWLEDWTVTRARAGIENLVRLTPQTARKLDGDNEMEVPISEVFRGDRLRVLPGETVPVDGEIVSGNSSIDQSLITGESLPVDKFEGDAVYGGTINRFGVFTMTATRIGEDSSLSRMIRLVREAEQKKAPMERIADRWASILVPLAILTSVLVGLISYAVLGAVEPALMRAITILVVFCPCSLVLATPTAIIAAIGNASHHGILIRSGEVVEQLGTVDMLAFDKTGTITHGQPQLTSVHAFDSAYDESEILSLAMSAEMLSEHPLASCIVRSAETRGVRPMPTSRFEMFRGEGIVVDLAEQRRGEQVLAGNERLLERYDIDLTDEWKTIAESRFSLGETVIWIAMIRDGHHRVLGLLSLADTIRETSAESIRQIRGSGVNVCLLTGDNDRAAHHVAHQSGIEQVRSRLLPEEKVEAIEDLKRGGLRVGMVGDGLNDAPALKTADVGIAMGKVGSDLTIDAADVVLMGDDISRIPFLIRLARRTKQTILTNIGLSMGINAVAVVLASTGIMGPVVGALVHNAGSVFVVLNASLLLNIRR